MSDTHIDTGEFGPRDSQFLPIRVARRFGEAVLPSLFISETSDGLDARLEAFRAEQAAAHAEVTAMLDRIEDLQ